MLCVAVVCAGVVLLGVIRVLDVVVRSGVAFVSGGVVGVLGVAFVSGGVVGVLGVAFVSGDVVVRGGVIIVLRVVPILVVRGVRRGRCGCSAGRW